MQVKFIFDNLWWCLCVFHMTIVCTFMPIRISFIIHYRFIGDKLCCVEKNKSPLLLEEKFTNKAYTKPSPNNVGNKGEKWIYIYIYISNRRRRYSGARIWIADLLAMSKGLKVLPPHILLYIPHIPTTSILYGYRVSGDRCRAGGEPR